MKTNFTFVSLLAVLVMAMSFSSALASNIGVEFNSVDLSGSNVVAVSPGEVVPVLVQFTADENASDVTLSAEIKGRNGVSVEKEISDIEAGSTYANWLKLKLPENTDDLSEAFTLYVTIASPTDSDVARFNVSVSLQKESYNLKILSVDYSPKVVAGKSFPVSVVAKNTGYNRADDVYVVASIPELNLQTRGYVGDLVVTPEDDDYQDKEDSEEQTLYLQVPEGTESGVYKLVVEVYNDDSSVEVSNLISVDGVAPNTEDKKVLDNGDSSGVSTSVVALTVILAIIFVVLLAVLVVLLTKKEKPIEEVETSYY